MNEKLTQQIIFRISMEEKKIVEEYCRKLRLKPSTFIRNLVMTTIEKEIENNK